MIPQDVWPKQAFGCIADVDEEALRIRREHDWTLGAFIGVFDKSLEQVLLVQLGDYARPRYDGNPWTLPGGAVDGVERPSAAVLRELREEIGIEASNAGLRLAGWFPRPYYRAWQSQHDGELILLFALTVEPSDLILRPAPPETIGAAFVRFSWSDWLSIPTHGTGSHPLQPMPRHWAYWTWIARKCLAEQSPSPRLWSYDCAEAMGRPPCSAKDAYFFK